MKDLNLWSGKIGEMSIYDEQKECSNEIINIFKRHEGPPILIAQMQQGKTGVAASVIHQFILFCNAECNGDLKNFAEIIYLINISDNDLREQTEKRLREAGLLNSIPPVHIFHHADLKKFTPNKNVKYRLLIMDECHYALERSNPSQKKPLDEFLKKCGIKYSRPIQEWKNQNNFVLSISATQYAQCIKAAIDDKCFKPVVLKLNPQYFSLKMMNNNCRIKASFNLTENDTVTDFFKERMIEFLSSCKSNGNGHMVVRATRYAPSIICDFLKNNYEGVVDFKIYDCKLKNIASLDDDLSTKFPKPSVTIIKGALRAGKTLTTTEHIRMWIETPKSKTDAMCQAIGRCLGQPNKLSSHSKADDTFPIYCNTSEIHLAIDFYDRYYNNEPIVTMPAGNNNTRADGSNIFEKWEVAKLLEEIPNEYRYEDGVSEGQKITRISANIVDNICKSICNNTSVGNETRIVHFDASDSDDYRKKLKECNIEVTKLEEFVASYESCIAKNIPPNSFLYKKYKKDTVAIGKISNKTFIA